ncbi:MAG: hypothetical protein WCJ30_18465 [Deltaproteobacteria bacterium]
MRALEERIETARSHPEPRDLAADDPWHERSKDDALALNLAVLERSGLGDRRWKGSIASVVAVERAIACDHDRALFDLACCRWEFGFRATVDQPRTQSMLGEGLEDDSHRIVEVIHSTARPPTVDEIDAMLAAMDHKMG